ncbi:MAG: hypothetical protein GX410_11075 [Elusimicrobia bacterium]|nr:hypothetical protein [Elusimicrobiota bacterium]
MPIKQLFTDILRKFYSGYGLYSDGKTLYVTRIYSSFKGLETEAKTYDLSQKKLQECLQEIFPYARTEDEQEQDKKQDDFNAAAHTKTTLAQKILHLKENIPDLMSVAVKDATVFYYAFATMSKPGPKLDIDSVISENPKAEFLSSPQLVHDWKHISIGDQNYILICAVQKKLLMDTWMQYDSLSLRPMRFEPAPWAALRAAWHYQPPSQQKTFEIRIVKGPDMSLASLNMGDTPIAWQLVPLDLNNLRATLFVIVQSFNTMARNVYGQETTPPIIIQGDDLPEDLQTKLTEMTNAPSIKVVKSPPYDGNMIAMGLGMGAMHPEISTMNLARGMLKPMSIVSTFPYLDSLISMASVLLATLFLWMHAGRIEQNISLQKALNEQTLWSQGMSNGQIGGDINNMKRSVGPIIEFYQDRISWVEVLNDLSNLLSKNIKMTSFVATDALWQKKAARSLKLTIIAKSGGVPGKAESELEELLAALKESKVLKKYFKTIKLDSANSMEDGTEYLAVISCYP